MQSQFFKTNVEKKEQLKEGALSLITQYTIDIDSKRDIILAIMKNINLCILCVLTIYFSTNSDILFSNGIAIGILKVILLIIIDYCLNCIMNANIRAAAVCTKSSMCIRIITYCNLKALLSAEEFENFKTLVTYIVLDKAHDD